ncbi:MarR family transcriptional regulator [Ancylobacter sp. MQZ15Z-1]|uniref:MarR family transcriptional regulator n=1 Tax=Ancylobacter mangrovi TaxID=2972472 RepID=A0A9X2PF26_9HYPH|nr:MarR family transcriptional regulator [Ancylobacter mangrovi]MCS0494372.1 MarR family transcriptional regulator [Ancylobacter mangrovi]
MNRDEPPPLPAPGDGKRGVDGHIGYLLRQAAHVQRQRLEAGLGELGLTAPQFTVLTMLEAYPGHSNADLARLALLTPQTMSVIVANLLRAGLVARRAHAVHGRIRQIALTEEGRRRLDAAKARVADWEDGMMAGLADEHRATIRHWLAGLARGAAETAPRSSGPEPP